MLVPIVITGAASGLLVYRDGEPVITARAVLNVTVLSGNEFDFALNAYARDVGVSIDSREVRDAATAALGPSSTLRAVRSRRTEGGSRFDIVLTAVGGTRADEAVVAAAETALRRITRQRVAELVVERQTAAADVESRRAFGRPGLPDNFLAAALERLADIDSQLAVARELLATEPIAGVSAAGTSSSSPGLRAARATVAGAAGGGLLGGLLLYTRRLRDQRDRGAE